MSRKNEGKDPPSKMRESSSQGSPKDEEKEKLMDIQDDNISPEFSDSRTIGEASVVDDLIDDEEIRRRSFELLNASRSSSKKDEIVHDLFEEPNELAAPVLDSVHTGANRKNPSNVDGAAGNTAPEVVDIGEDLIADDETAMARKRQELEAMRLQLAEERRAKDAFGSEKNKEDDDDNIDMLPLNACASNYTPGQSDNADINVSRRRKLKSVSARNAQHNRETSEIRPVKLSTADEINDVRADMFALFNEIIIGDEDTEVEVALEIPLPDALESKRILSLYKSQMWRAVVTIRQLMDAIESGTPIEMKQDELDELLVRIVKLFQRSFLTYQRQKLQYPNLKTYTHNAKVLYKTIEHFYHVFFSEMKKVRKEYAMTPINKSLELESYHSDGSVISRTYPARKIDYMNTIIVSAKKHAHYKKRCCEEIAKITAENTSGQDKAKAINSTYEKYEAKKSLEEFLRLENLAKYLSKEVSLKESGTKPKVSKSSTNLKTAPVSQFERVSQTMPTSMSHVQLSTSIQSVSHPLPTVTPITRISLQSNTQTTNTMAGNIMASNFQNFNSTPLPPKPISRGRSPSRGLVENNIYSRNQDSRMFENFGKNPSDGSGCNRRSSFRQGNFGISSTQRDSSGQKTVHFNESLPTMGFNEPDNTPGVYPNPSSSNSGNGQKQNNALDSTILQDVRAGATKEFYLALPPPWNVLPRVDSRRLEDQKQLQIADITKFNGDKRKYFTWRALVITHIHQANISITEKITAIKKACDTEKTLELEVLFMLTHFGPEVYRQIIEALEENYGGNIRARNIYLCQLTAPGLQYDDRDVEKMRQVKSRIQQFMIGCSACGDSGLITSPGTFKDVMVHLFKERHEYVFTQYAAHYDLPSDLNSLLKWLTKEIGCRDKIDTTTMFRYRDKDGKKSRTENKKPFGSAFFGSGNSGPSKDGPKNEEESPQSDESNAASDAESVIVEDDPKAVELQYSDLESDDEALVFFAKSGKFSLPICQLHLQKKKENERHFLFHCQIFKDMDISAKNVYVRTTDICRNCLSPNHKIDKCRSNRLCQKCQRKHHTLLHFEKKE